MRTPAAIIAAVAHHHGVLARDITGRSRSIVATRARQDAMLALREELGLTLVEIGRAVNRHNTTVDVGIRTAAARRGTPVRLPEHAPSPAEKSGRQRARDPWTDEPIGTIPRKLPDGSIHPLYELDQEMARGRQHIGLGTSPNLRHAYDDRSRQSGLADF